MAESRRNNLTGGDSDLAIVAYMLAAIVAAFVAGVYCAERLLAGLYRVGAVLP